MRLSPEGLGICRKCENEMRIFRWIAQYAHRSIAPALMEEIVLTIMVPAALLLQIQRLRYCRFNGIDDQASDLYHLGAKRGNAERT